MPQLLIATVLAFAVFTQTLAGFGGGLVAMAFLPALMGLPLASPLMALLASVAELAIIARYRQAFRFGAVWPLALASAAGVPLGLWLLRGLDEAVLLRLLGVVLSGYALYALLKLRLPRLRHAAWSYVFGFAAGLLGGAYNTAGPPVVIFGHCRSWPPDEFKSNLQGFFLFNSVLVIAGHGLAHNFTPAVWQQFLLGLPAIALGLAVGMALERRVDAKRFGQIVLWLLLLMGLRLVLT
jgi:uncharacterized protein